MNCINIEHYNAGIYVVTKQKINNITDVIKEIINEMSLNDYLVDDRTPFVITPNEATIYFKQGSRKELFQQQSTQEGVNIMTLFMTT